GSHQVHDDHEDHRHHDHGDMVSDFKKRFFISLIITIPILIMSPMIQSFIGVDWRFANDQYIVFALATFVFFYGGWPFITDRKSTRLNSSHVSISYAVFCLKKKIQ